LDAWAGISTLIGDAHFDRILSRFERDGTEYWADPLAQATKGARRDRPRARRAADVLPRSRRPLPRGSRSSPRGICGTPRRP